MSRLVLHAFVDFLRLKDLPAVGKREMHPAQSRLGVCPQRARASTKKRPMGTSDMGVTIRPDPE